jgi:hypothetical protein
MKKSYTGIRYSVYAIRLFLCLVGGFGESLLEAINATASVDDLLGAGVERVAGRADGCIQRFAGGAHDKAVATGAGSFGFWVVRWVDISLHTYMHHSSSRWLCPGLREVLIHHTLTSNGYNDINFAQLIVINTGKKPVDPAERRVMEKKGEKWFMVEGHTNYVPDLTKAGIPAMIVEVERPRTVKGVAFPKEYAEASFEQLGLGTVWVDEAPTNRSNLVLLTPTGTVIVERSAHLEYWADIEPVLRRYAFDVLKRTIKVCNPHGVMSEPSFERSTLSIRFWSSPNDIAVFTLHKAFGIALDAGQRDACLPSGRGIPIADPKNKKVIVAEMVDTTLYVLFDLPHGRNAGMLMEKILQEALRINAIPAVGHEELDQRALYAFQCQRRMQVLMQVADGDIAAQEKKVADVSAQLTQLARQLESLRAKAHAMKTDTAAWKTQMTERFATEYDRLLQIPHVAEVKVDSMVVSVKTDTIFLEYNGDRYELGDYRIDFHYDGVLSITNERVVELTGQKKYHHPHIFGGDDNWMEVCLGNIGPGVRKLLGSFEYAVATQVLIRFLHTVTNDPKYISYLTSNWKPMPKEIGGRKEAV